MCFQSTKPRYIKALCGSIEDWLARLEIYEDDKSANENNSLILEILFTDVEYVDCTKMRQKEVITIGMKNNKSFLFYADSHSSTARWHTFCGLLFTIPKYAIPEIPKENIALQQGINQYGGSRKCDTGIYSYIHSICIVIFRFAKIHFW